MLPTRFQAPGSGNAVWVVGDRYTTRISGAETGGRLALIEAVVPPGGGPPPHVHTREDEAFCVLDGTVAFHADGQEFRAEPGAWVTLARGSRHGFRNVGPTPARMLILVTPSGLEEFFAEVGRPDTGDPADAAVRPEDVVRLLSAAPRYGLKIEGPPPPAAAGPAAG